MNTRIVKLYQGLLPIRNNIVLKALESNQGLLVMCDDDEYILSFEDLKNPVRQIPVSSKYGGDVYLLNYYRCPVKEDPRQNKIFLC